MRVTSSAQAFFEVVDVLIEVFSWGVSFQKSNGFALYETFSDPLRVAEREMRILKSLCRFKMCAKVKDSLVVISLAFINSCIWKVKSAGQEKSTKILNFRGKSWKINFFHFLFTNEAAWRNVDSFHEQKNSLTSNKRYFQGNSEARHTEIIQKWGIGFQDNKNLRIGLGYWM